MAQTVRQCIVEALDDLGEDDFCRFKADLREVQLPSGFRRIPWGRLEKASKLDTAKLMVDSYRDSLAGDLAVKVLSCGNQFQTAESLQKQLNSIQFQSRAPPLPTASCGAVQGVRAGGEHPVDRHFSRIVQGFSSIDGVLDVLLGAHVITPEHYDTIRGRSPRQEKVRELLTVVRGLGAGAKDKLWDAMVASDPYFTNSLVNN